MNTERRNIQCLACVALIAGAVVTRTEEWHLRQSPVTNLALNAVTYAGNQFVAVGDGGTILTSPNGSNWTSRASGTTGTLHAVTFALNRIVAVGSSEPLFGDGISLTSLDGINWDTHTNSPWLHNVIHGNGVFVAAGGGGTYTSSDGTDWIAHSSVFGWDSLSFGNGVFAGVVWFNSSTIPELMTSPDAINWQMHLWGEFPTARAIAFGAGRFVAVGGNIDLRRYSMTTAVSTNGTDWTPQKVIGNSTFLRKITYGGGLFFALGDNSITGQVGVYATSPDGFSWSSNRLPPTPALRDAAFGADTYVVVGDNGTILQSDPLTPPATSSETRLLGILPGSPAWISLSGPPGKAFRVEYAEDLSINPSWNPLGQGLFADAAVTIADTNAITASRRFYRAIVP